MAEPDLLAKLRGQDIGAARNSLPACREDSPDECRAGVEVPELGLVCVTFRKQRSQHHRTIRWFWVPVSAELE